MNKMLHYLSRPQWLGAACLALMIGLLHAQSAAEPALSFQADDPKLQWESCVAPFPAGCQVVALHGDLSQPNADIFFKIEPGYRIPAHSHTSPERMVLISGRLSLTYEGQQPVVLTPGTYNYGPGGVKHQGQCLSAEPCVLFIAFQETIDVFSDED